MNGPKKVECTESREARANALYLFRNLGRWEKKQTHPSAAIILNQFVNCGNNLNFLKLNPVAKLAMRMIEGVFIVPRPDIKE